MPTHGIGRREFLNMAACAVALPNAAEFLRAWFSAGHAHGQQSGWQPAEPPLLANYAPKFFEPRIGHYWPPLPNASSMEATS